MVDDENTSWYGVRCVFQHGPDDPDGTSYEERVTLWRAASFEQAIELAEGEAREYVDDLPGVGYLDLAQGFLLSEPPGHGAEVFSLIRDSHLAADGYLDAYFDTGTEYTGTVGE